MKMKALVAHDYGQPDTYEVVEADAPSPATGEILVRVVASAVNMADLRVARGDLSQFVQLPLPHVLGADFAGTVTAVGDGVSRFAVGDEVFGYTTSAAMAAFGGPNSPTGTGSMAEYLTVRADTPFVAHRPAGLSVQDAAALATTGLTARALALTADVQPGERVLVVGATGAVGTALMTILSSSGAQITATAMPADADAITALGADHVIGFDPAEYPADVDVILNVALPGNSLDDLIATVKPGGRLFTIVPPPPNPEQIPRQDITVTYVADANADLGGMTELAQLALDGGIRPVIAKVYTLDDAVQAYVDFVGEHPVGKLVVTVPQ
ncbi:NADP-dependent oxidoreductase [Microbacterium esteraromaticum]|uniref:NADP-dependent oxidoreductase n=1 Tax=Microbacterium esteraromaticum TaxID=57043 RepID=UPI001CD4B43D|nr:NADP-dependent oxidoreductase [Microbacterium esteraromaticum]MCA1307393.1 NADP-dependent oxidoreductase [Microbacterium esteraromaticum]